jgi:diheme cytochrome c
VRRVVLSLLVAGALASCSVDLPEPDSPGARVLTARCGSCHRLYAPGTMTLAMWDLQLGRMRALYAQRGIPWLAPAEEQTLRAYLAKYAGTR